MSWRDKVQTMREGKNYQICVPPSLPKLPKTPKPSSVSYGSTPQAPFQEKTGFSSQPASTAAFLKNLKKPDIAAAANDPVQAVGLVANSPVDRLVSTKVPVSSGEVSMQVCSTAAVVGDPDRWCWPHGSAMTGREIDAMAERTSLFNRRGLEALEAELLADKLVNRDREADDRRLCLECAYLSGRAGAMRCAQWQRAELGAPGIPSGMTTQLQRCDGFKDQNPQRTTS